MKKLNKKNLNKKSSAKMNTVKAYGCKCGTLDKGWRGVSIDSQPWPW